MKKHFSKYEIEKKRFFGSPKCDLSYFFDMNATHSILFFFLVEIFSAPSNMTLVHFFALPLFSNLRSVKSFFCGKDFFGFCLC